MDSSSQADQQSKFSNYQRGNSLLASSTNNFSNAPTAAVPQKRSENYRISLSMQGSS